MKNWQSMVAEVWKGLIYGNKGLLSVELPEKNVIKDADDDRLGWPVSDILTTTYQRQTLNSPIPRNFHLNFFFHRFFPYKKKSTN
jgi:hypothetical protein